LCKGTLGSVASSLVATLYQGNPDRNHKLWNIVSTERYILHMQVLLLFLYSYEADVIQGLLKKNKKKASPLYR
jgi:hypothetical protein